MSGKDSSLLASSAIRIFLMHEINRTEVLLKSYELRGRIAHSQDLKQEWMNIATAAQRVLQYMRQCQYDEGESSFALVHGLCAIGAAQDALASLLSYLQSDLGSENRCQYFLYVAQDHELRSKCLVNALVSSNRQDTELAVLWEQAAAHLLRQCQLRRNDSAEKHLSSTCTVELTKLNIVLCKERFATDTDSAEVRELKAKASRSIRFAAVYRILEVENDYSTAATCYIRAIELYDNLVRSVKPVAAKLRMAAAATLMRTGERTETQALSRIDPQDPIFINLKQEHDYFTTSAERVEQLLHKIHEVESDRKCTLAMIARCTVPSASHSLMTILVDTDNKVIDLWERCTAKLVEGQASRHEAEGLMNQFDAVCKMQSTIRETVRELEVNIDRVSFYNSQVLQCNHIGDDTLRFYWRHCWERAADLTNTVIQMSSKCVIDGVYQALTSKSQYLSWLNSLKAQLYSTHAISAINTANDCWNAARGAKADQMGGCDPREAQWWRCAADKQVLAVEKCMGAIGELVSADGGDEWHRTLLDKAMNEPRTFANGYAAAAGYLRRAHQHRIVYGHMADATLVSEVLVLLAELGMQKFTCSSSSDVVYEQTAKLCLTWIDAMTTSKEQSAEEVKVLLAKNYAYTRSWVDATASSMANQGMWRAAVLACAQAFKLGSATWSVQAGMAAVSAIIYAAQAEHHDCTHKLVALEHAARMMEKAKNADDAAVSNYCATLAVRLCKLVAPVEELHLLLKTTPLEGKEKALLDPHVEACILDRYSANHPLTNKRFDLCELLTLTAQCYMEAARTKSPAWDAAVAMCVEAQGTRHWKEAIGAIGRYKSAAEASANSDPQLAELYTSAAREAQHIFAEEKLSRRDYRTYYEYRLNAADHHAFALLAQRKNHVLLSKLHTQVAKLLTEVCDGLSSFSPVDRAKRQSIIVHIQKLEKRLSKMQELARDQQG